MAVKQITKEELEAKYNSMPVAELAEELGIKQQTLYNHLHRLGIPLKGRKAHAGNVKLKVK